MRAHKLTHRSKDVEEAAFSNHDDCIGSRERTEDHKGKDPGEHEHTDNDLGARDTPGGGQVPAIALPLVLQRGGGGGSDGVVDERQRVKHQILGAVSPVDTAPGPLPVCRALKTHPISSSRP